MVFGALATPVVHLSGVYDWRTRFKARHTRIFDHKLFFGLIFLIMSFTLVICRTLLPDLLFEEGPGKWAYIITLFVATGIDLYLGYLGSKFI